MSGPKRNPDKLNTIGIVVVGICGAVLVYVIDRRAPGVLHERHARRSRRWPTTAARTRRRSRAARPTQLRNITEVGKNAAAPTSAAATYRDPIDDAMKLSCVDDGEGRSVAPRPGAAAAPTKPTIEPVFGRPQARRRRLRRAAPAAAPARRLGDGSGRGLGRGAGSGRRRARCTTAARRSHGCSAHGVVGDGRRASAERRKRRVRRLAARAREPDARCAARRRGARRRSRTAWPTRRCRTTTVLAPPPTYKANGVTVDEHLGAKVPLDARFRTSGRQARHARRAAAAASLPTILTFNYSDCPMLCSLQLNGLSTVLLAS